MDELGLTVGLEEPVQLTRGAGIAHVGIVRRPVDVGVFVRVVRRTIRPTSARRVYRSAEVSHSECVHTDCALSWIRQVVRWEARRVMTAGRSATAGRSGWNHALAPSENLVHVTSGT